MRLTKFTVPFLKAGVLLLLVGCSSSIEKVKIEGEAQGTTYNITYFDEQGRDFSEAIDSLLYVIDMSMSTYRNESLISEFNTSDSCSLIDVHFLHVYQESWMVFDKTNGAFDPTVGPLVRLWGFGPENKINPSADIKKEVERLKPMVNFDNLSIYGDIMFNSYEDMENADYQDNFLCKKFPEMSIDFNAIAQGYSVDQIGVLLEKRGIQNYLVELGGELLARGEKPDGNQWKVAIDNPDQEQDAKYAALLSVKDKAVASSGNYRKFYIKDGVKYSHTIDPRTGYPVNHSLLSATVIASSCMQADAFATAFMVMGHEQVIDFFENEKPEDMEIYLVYQGAEGELVTYASSGLEGVLNEQI